MKTIQPEAPKKVLVAPRGFQGRKAGRWVQYRDLISYSIALAFGVLGI